MWALFIFALMNHSPGVPLIISSSLRKPKTVLVLLVFDPNAPPGGEVDLYQTHLRFALRV